MDRNLLLVPHGWPCELGQVTTSLCAYPVGPLTKDTSIVSLDGEAPWVVDSSSCFWAGAKGKEARDRLIVQPLRLEVVDVHEA